MRPDWGKAPSWANYAAQELSGTYYFHETQPRYQELTGEWVSKGQREIVPRVTVTPQQTLESRPIQMSVPLMKDDSGIWRAAGPAEVVPYV